MPQKVPWSKLSFDKSYDKNINYKVLLDTGSSASVISSRISKYGKIIRDKTAAGEFLTNKTCKIAIQLPEFSTSKKIVWNYGYIA